MSECVKCNGWGVGDVTGFACPSCPTVKQSLTVELVSNPDELTAAMQADAAPVAWMYKNWRGELVFTKRLTEHRREQYETETPLYAAPVDARVSTSSPVVSYEKPETSGKLRPAVAVICDLDRCSDTACSVAVIEADRAALVAEIVDWLDNQMEEYPAGNYALFAKMIRDEIAAKWGGE